MTDSTITSPLATLLDSILKIAADSTINAALVPANTILTSLQTNGSSTNLAAQALAFQAGLVTVLPNLENTVVEQVAGVVKTAIDAEAVAAEAAVNTPASPTTAA